MTRNKRNIAFLRKKMEKKTNKHVATYCQTVSEVPKINSVNDST